MRSTRRVFLRDAGFATMLVVSYPSLSGLNAFAEVEATPPNTAGPYYVPGAPVRANLRDTGPKGRPLIVRGRVIDTAEKPLPDAEVEVWHSDPSGQYDMETFRYRATIPVQANGSYAFETYFPGHYSSRPQHIHYRISAPGHSPLTTQLYFQNDPFFEGTPENNYTKDSLVRYPQLILPVDTKSSVPTVYFQIALKA